jgi:NADH-quinone oxidoreductase subunit K
MLNANLSLVAFSGFVFNRAVYLINKRTVFVFSIITVAAAEVAVGLAILVALYRARQTTDVKDIMSLKF